MIVEVDQSVKIEQLSRNTIIALSNDIEFAISIPSAAKRKLQTEFRRRGTPKQFRYRTFMAGVVLLLFHARLKHVPSLVIDREYTGQEQILRGMFVEMCRKLHMKMAPMAIKEIGKRSRAHDVAFKTMRRRREVDRVLEYNELRKLALK